MNSYQWPWKLEKLPFIYAPLTSPSNGNGLPDFLPMVLDVDRETGLLVQLPQPGLDKVLEKAYAQGSMITGMIDETPLGESYLKELLGFLTSSLGTSRLDGKRVLEIGCGTGYSLLKIKELGADVLGVEPGPHGKDGGRQFGVKVINDFFPSPEVGGVFDVIVMHCVLEHIPGTRAFLAEVRKYLGRGGKLIVTVPNDEPYIGSGDVSSLFHEHYNYFTTVSLKNVLRRAGFDPVVETSETGGSLNAWAIAGDVLPAEMADKELEHINAFRASIGHQVQKMVNLVETCKKNGQTLGIFVPSRAANVLSMISGSVDIGGIRFFDDNVHLHNTYLPGMDISIEPRANLISKPTDILLIMSRTFGAKIAESLRGQLPSSVRVVTWHQLFETAPAA